MTGALGSATTIWGSVAIHLWQTTLVLAVLLLLDRLLVRAPARYRVTIWWLGVLKLALPAGLVAVWLPARSGVVITDSLMTGVRILVEPLEPVLRPQVLQQGSWPAMLLTGAWAAGVLGIGLLLLRRWLLLPRGGRPGSDEPAIRAASEACGVDPLDVWVIEHGGTPCLVGFLRPRILVPKSSLSALSSDELRAVLVHEDTHRRRRDPLRQLALLPLALAYWFYPPTWWLLRRLGEAEESACDEAVLAAGVSPQVYARAIARVVGHALEIPLGAAALAGSGRGALSRRLRELPNLTRRKPMSSHRIALLAAVIVVAGGALVADSTALPAGVQERILTDRVPVLTQEPVQEGVSVLRRRGDTLNRLGARGERPITLEVRDEPLGQVLDRIERAGGIIISVFSGDDLDLSRPISVTVTNSTVAEALRIVAQAAEFAYSAESEDLVIVSSGPFRVGSDIRAPARITYVAPKYPETARADRLGGTVVMEIEVDRQGAVVAARVIRGVREDLDEAARTATLDWAYEPVLYNEQSVPALLTVTVKFHLQ